MIYCTACGASQEAGSRFCTNCGKQMSASLPTATRTVPDESWGTDPPTHPRSPGRRLAVVAALGLLLGGGGVAAWVTLAPGTGQPTRASQPPGQSPAAASPATQRDQPPSGSVSPGTAAASASCMSSASRDAAGTIFTYGPEKTIDGLLDTAWRCDGDGVGQRLEISFPGPVTLTSIGMVPGYAKTDPRDGTDRYAQNRRISAVRYTFDDDSAVTQSFDTAASRRFPQLISLPNVSTSHVTITILSSVGAVSTGSQEPFDKIAVSEVTFSA